MLTAFSRNGVPSRYSAELDGVNDWIALSSVTGGPSIPGEAIGQPNTKMLISMWVKINNVTAPNAAQIFFSQGLSNDNQNVRTILYYQPKNSSGTPFNRIIVEHRENGTSSRRQEIYNLYGGSNGAITGLTSNTDFWDANSPNLNTNAKGYVNLTFILSYPNVPSSFANVDFKVYWNGSQLSASAVQPSGEYQNGFAFGDYTQLIGANAANISPSSQFAANIDEIFLPSATDFIGWKAANGGISSDDAVATALWNGGEPYDNSNLSNGGNRWFSFENNWNSVDGTRSVTPVNNTTFSTDNAHS